MNIIHKYIKYLTVWSSVLLKKLTVTQLVKKNSSCIGLEGSLPWSQEPTTGLFPDPDESNLISLKSILILSSDVRIRITSGLLLSGFRTNI